MVENKGTVVYKATAMVRKTDIPTGGMILGHLELIHCITSIFSIKLLKLVGRPVDSVFPFSDLYFLQDDSSLFMPFLLKAVKTY
jgi:hypothetical protein